MVSSVLFCASVLAGTIGDPRAVGQGKVRAGLETEFILDRDLDFDGGSGLAAGQTFAGAELDGNHRSSTVVEYGLTDIVSVYAKLGAADFGAEAESRTGSAKTADLDFESNTGLGWGLGARAVKNLDNGIIVGATGGYFASGHRAKVTDRNVNGTVSSTTYKDVSYGEWQIAAYVAKEIGQLTPYAGIRWSDASFEIEDPSNGSFVGRAEFKSDENLGFVLGTRMDVNERISIGIEGSLNDESAIAIAADWKF